MRESLVELVLAKHIEDAEKDTGGVSMTIRRIEVQHLGSGDGQRDTYTPTLPGDLFQVRTESGTGRLIVIDGMTQIVYAKGAWSRVKIEYGEQGKPWTKKGIEAAADDADADMVAARTTARGVGERLDAALDRVEELEEEARVVDEALDKALDEDTDEA